MAIGDIFRLTRTVLIDGVQHVNVMHFNDTLGDIADPEQTLMAHWDVSSPVGPEAPLRGLMRGYTTFTPVGLSCQRISPTKGELYEQPLAPYSITPGVGLPTFAQIGVRIATARNDRSGRGRNYYSALAEVDVDGNDLNSSGQTLVNAFIAKLVEYFTENGAEFIGFVIGVWSEKLSEFNAATTFSSASTVGTMVSRRVGHGS